MTKGILYYSDCRGDPLLLEACRRQLRRAAGDLPIVSVTLQPIDFGDIRIVLPLERGRLTMFRQQLAGLRALDTDVVFFCEHDCVYPAAHFACDHFTLDPTAADRYWYDCAWWRVDVETGRAVTYLAQSVSGLCGARDLLLDHYTRRVAQVRAHGYDKNLGYEPGMHAPPRGLDAVPFARYWARVPYLDLRHGCNLTASRWDPSQFYDPRTCTQWRELPAGEPLPGWGVPFGRMRAFLTDLAREEVAA